MNEKKLTAKETKESLAIKKEQEDEKRIAGRLEEVLKEEGRGIQPFLSVTEFGIVPNVRLVLIPKKEEVKEEENGSK